MPDARKTRMLRSGTPVEDYRDRYGLWVKREDLACPPPGPPFSKTRGVYAHVASRPERLIGVLDTAHSQAGWAVARACQILGKDCINFWPRYKADPDGLRVPQQRAAELGATPWELKAGRSCILYHEANKIIRGRGGYMMPNALKLPESVDETAKEVPRAVGLSGGLLPNVVIIPVSSGTIAAGVVRGLGTWPTYVLHLGYSRSHEEVVKYVRAASGVADAELVVVDEGYQYKDAARPGETPPWPCNEFYDLKAFRWWVRDGLNEYAGTEALLWNIG